MDSGDRSVDRLKAPEPGFKSHSFSNLFQGFFGVSRAPNSTSDIPSLNEQSEVKSLDTIVSPSGDDSWILSQFMHDRQGKGDENNLKRNVSWTGLGNYKQIHLKETSSGLTSETENMRNVNNKLLLSTDHRQDQLSDVPTIKSKSLLEESDEDRVKTKIVIAKSVERFNYPKNILSSFLVHDLPQGELEPRQSETSLRRASSLDGDVSLSVAASGSNDQDRIDCSVLPTATASSEKISDSKPSLRDLLWSFNHEKINVSRKEMNLIASIDQ